MEKYKKFQGIPLMVLTGSVFLIILDLILKWKLSVVLLWGILIISLAWFLHSLALYHVGASKWIGPAGEEWEDLFACGYKFLRYMCQGNDVHYANYQLFCEQGGDEELFLKLVKSDLGMGEWLKPLAIIGGFPDIKDWENLSLKARMAIMESRWLDSE